MPKKPSHLYVEVMAHENKVFGASKEVMLDKIRISLRKFVRGERPLFECFSHPLPPPAQFTYIVDVIVYGPSLPKHTSPVGKETDLKLKFQEVQGFLMLQIVVQGFGRSWQEGRAMDDYTAHEMEDKERYTTHIRTIKTATSVSQAKHEYSATQWQIP